MGCTIRLATGARRPHRLLGRWLADLSFEHPAQHLVLEELVQRVERAEVLGERIEASMVELLPRWALAPVALAVQTLRGISILGAITLVAEIGSFSRFDNPRQLMAYLGLVPSEHSSGSTVRRGPITPIGNRRGPATAWRAPAWSRRPGPTASRHGCRESSSNAPSICPSPSGRWGGGRWGGRRWGGRRRSGFAGAIATSWPPARRRPQRPGKVVTAIARELAGFLWAIARMVEPVRT